VCRSYRRSCISPYLYGLILQVIFFLHIFKFDEFMLSVFEACKQNVWRWQNVCRSLVAFPRLLISKQKLLSVSLKFHRWYNKPSGNCMLGLYETPCIFGRNFVGTHCEDGVNSRLVVFRMHIQLHCVTENHQLRLWNGNVLFCLA
jgi:hypothetical protein